MSKVLITGAAGFIGSNLSEYLLNKDYQIVGLDNFNDYYNPRIKEYNIKDFMGSENFTLARVDLLDFKTLEQVFEKEKPKTVIHLAAWAGVTRSLQEPVTYVRNNIEGTVNLAELCVKHKVQNFVFASTSSIYGDSKTPFKEDTSTSKPLAPYPATKKACEVILYTYHKNFNLNVSILRIFNPIGPRIRPDIFLPKVVRSCLYGNECPIYWKESELEQTGRDYTYIFHMLEAIEYIIRNPFDYEIFNLGNSAPVLLSDFIATVEKVAGKKANKQYKQSRKGEMLTTFADTEKAQNMLNYRPRTSIEESIKIYFDWFLAQEEWYKKGEY